MTDIGPKPTGPTHPQPSRPTSPPPAPPSPAPAPTSAGPRFPEPPLPVAGTGSSHRQDTGECCTPSYGAVSPAAGSLSSVVAEEAGASSRWVGVREGGPARRGFTPPTTIRPPGFVTYTNQVRALAAPFLGEPVDRRSR